jgi:N-methylhydantoinase A/oxoprolinase/acetone carboxylase beta subunit
MNKILGIDTGGTYTDMVIVSADKKEVLAKCKTLTTKDDLTSCISAGIAKLPEKCLADISMISLSTTLATNAIVENKGCKTGLILIGGRPKGPLCADEIALVKGRYDIKGRQKEPVDVNEIDAVVESFRGKVDAMAISGYASVRNPRHEMYVRQVVEQKLGIPVACAHELTSSLGFYDRTVTVNLNARLIPMLCHLMDAVRSVVEAHHICAPLMVVKGDGDLMTEAVARRKPIETILSGPASSIIGGVHLSGEQDAFIIDMGGTTSDIAHVQNGRAEIRNEGARVGGWFTHVRAVEVFTVGLGGDSRIYIDSEGEIKIGPEKSMPLTMAAARYPRLKDELSHIYECGSYKDFQFHDHEAFVLAKKYENLSYTDEEKILIEILRYEPHTLDYLKNHISINKLRHLLDGLVHDGVIMRISLTPTDILHVTGDYRCWDPEIAEIAVKIVADKFGVDRNAFIRSVREALGRRLDQSVMEAAFYFDHQNVDMTKGGACDYFMNKLFFDDGSCRLKASYELKQKIVGIGAPANAWVAGMGKCLNTTVEVLEHAEVANAVGAAVGRDVEVVEILIRPDSLSNKYLVYSPVDRKEWDDLDRATEYAFQVGINCIKETAYGCHYDLKKDVEDLNFEDVTNGRVLFMERVVKLTAHFKR